MTPTGPRFRRLADLLLVPLGIAVAVRMIPEAVMVDCRAKAQAAAERPVNRGAAVVMLELDAWFERRANVRLHRTLRVRPADRFAEEKMVLRPLPEVLSERELLVPPVPSGYRYVEFISGGAAAKGLSQAAGRPSSRDHRPSARPSRPVTFATSTRADAIPHPRRLSSSRSR